MWRMGEKNLSNIVINKKNIATISDFPPPLQSKESSKPKIENKALQWDMGFRS